MKHWNLTIGAFATTLALGAGCGAKDPKTMTKEELVEAVKPKVTAMVNAVKENKDDCDKLAGALDPIATEMNGLQARMKELGKDPANQKFFEEKGKDLEPDKAAMGDLMAAMTKCATNEKMKAVATKMAPE
jgi:hypothetical protein